jgi:hypothetical protein
MVALEAEDLLAWVDRTSIGWQELIAAHPAVRCARNQDRGGTIAAHRRCRVAIRRTAAGITGHSL